MSIAAYGEIIGLFTEADIASLESARRAELQRQWAMREQEYHAYQLKISRQSSISKGNCKNCGAPHEPVCSYCKTKSN